MQEKFDSNRIFFSIVKGSTKEYLVYLLKKFKKSVHNDSPKIGII
jgi:hypothetical protein